MQVNFVAAPKNNLMTSPPLGRCYLFSTGFLQEGVINSGGGGGGFEVSGHRDVTAKRACKCEEFSKMAAVSLFVSLLQAYFS